MSQYQRFVPPATTVAEFSPIPLVLLLLGLIILYLLAGWCKHAVQYWWQQKVAYAAAAAGKKDSNKD